MADINVDSEVAGVVAKIAHVAGERVERDEPIVYVEIMKMELPVPAPSDGTIVKLLVGEGETIAEGQTVAILRT